MFRKYNWNSEAEERVAVHQLQNPGYQLLVS